LPDDVLRFVAGITTIPIRLLALVALLGRDPAILVASSVGAELASGQILVAGRVVLGFVIVWAVGYSHRARLVAVLDRDL
jgi:uncharacterized membrane protein YdjX (TVP38/TMEM64 family)